MKVLFAVSDERNAKDIINIYQQKYKEIISSKNVYYFNAIVQELKNNKTYDAIVIREDLEPITGNDFEKIDKDLFKKLDMIGDEATKITGEDIPIILICSDRRDKTDALLSKIFGIGIYNVLLGADRNIENVCQLINKPRSKKEAKIYYRIEAEDIGYITHDKNEVSEEEIQNILSHYKKIGMNEKKCVESFDRIAEQYDNSQLRIIVKFLPMEVKAILESRSMKYQKLMTSGTVLSNGQYSPYNQINNKKILQKDFVQKNIVMKNNITEPVIIPSNININRVQNNSQARPVQGMQSQQLPRMQTQQLNMQRMYMNNQGTVNNQNNLYNDIYINNKDIQEEINKTNYNESYVPDIMKEQNTDNNLLEENEEVKRGRGRPRKVLSLEELEEIENRKKRGRGRPRKEENIEKENIKLDPNNLNDLIEDSKQLNIENNLFNNIEENKETDILNDNLNANLDEIEDINIGIDNTMNPYQNSLIQSQESLIQQSQIPPMVMPQMNQPLNQTMSQQVNNQQINYTTQQVVNVNRKAKIIAFVGTSKNGTSFIINNLALLLAQNNIKTAILDLTVNKNDYYLFTNNDTRLMQMAANSFKNLANGIIKGLDIVRNLTLYTAVPEVIPVENSFNPNIITNNISTVYDVVLLDCDFNTNPAYFVNASEIYLVQTMDTFTIQPLTQFLNNLKTRGLLDSNKLRVVINKYIKLRQLDEKLIIGGMSKYNEPSMTLQKDLFDARTIKYIKVPFEMSTYAKYLDSIATCKLSLMGYSPYLLASLEELKKLVYPLKNNTNNFYNQPEKKGFWGK